jgi:hypothetical protein
MKLTSSQLRRIIKEEVQKVISENASETLLDKVYIAWGHSGMTPQEIRAERPDLDMFELAQEVRAEYGDMDGGQGYTAFIKDFYEVLMDEDEAVEVADDIWSDKYDIPAEEEFDDDAM